jgi:hypothetical protein
MALSKVYTKSPCDLGSMISTIQHDSAITIALDLTNTNLLGDQLTIAFLSDMADWTQVDADVAANNGLPLTTTTVQPVSVTTLPAAPAFATNALGTKALYVAITGMQQAVTTGAQDILFTVPYAQSEISGIHIIGSEALDIASLYVLDSTTGTYSGHANYVLNQFGYAVNLPAGEYIFESPYTATLYQNMQIKISYTSISNKTIGINFILNQVK